MIGSQRGKIAAQVTEAAERIGSNVTTVLALTVLAVVLAAGALLVSMRALSKTSQPIDLTRIGS